MLFMKWKFRLKIIINCYVYSNYKNYKYNNTNTYNTRYNNNIINNKTAIFKNNTNFNKNIN